MATTDFATQINNFATRVGTECKTLHGKIGVLTSLETSDKTSIVKALNEVKASAVTLQTSLNELTARVGTNETGISTNTASLATNTGNIATLQSQVATLISEVENLQADFASKSEIDDTQVLTTKTYSSSKIASEITNAKQTVKDEILNGAGEAFDTLKELADLIQTNESAIDALEALAAGHVKYDGAQELTNEQKAQARTNIGAAGAEDHVAVAERVSAVETKATNNATEMTNLKTALGNLETDFAAAFEAALV